MIYSVRFEHLKARWIMSTMAARSCGIEFRLLGWFWIPSSHVNSPLPWTDHADELVIIDYGCQSINWTAHAHKTMLLIVKVTQLDVRWWWPARDLESRSTQPVDDSLFTTEQVSNSDGSTASQCNSIIHGQSITAFIGDGIAASLLNDHVESN